MQKKKEKFKPLTKTPLVRIYITNDTREKLKSICQKYKLSMSSTIRIASYYMFKYYLSKNETYKLMEFYQDKNTEKVTTYIKPRCMDHQKDPKKEVSLDILLQMNYTPKTLTMIYSNSAFLLANNLLEPNLKKQICDKLNAEKEAFWNFNNELRANWRVTKHIIASLRK